MVCHHTLLGIHVSNKNRNSVLSYMHEQRHCFAHSRSRYRVRSQVHQFVLVMLCSSCCRSYRDKEHSSSSHTKSTLISPTNKHLHPPASIHGLRGFIRLAHHRQYCPPRVSALLLPLHRYRAFNANCSDTARRPCRSYRNVEVSWTS